MTRRNDQLPQSILNGVSRPVLVTALVSALAAGVLPGCASSSTSGSSRTSSQTNYKTQYTARDYDQRAGQAGLEDAAFVDAAKAAAARNAAQRDAAWNTLQNVDGQFMTAYSAQKSAFDAAVAQKEAGMVMAQDMLDIYSAKLEQMRADADALHQHNYAAMQRRNGSAAVSMLDWQRQFEKMYAEAEFAWHAAQGEHQAMLAERTGVHQRGQAQLNQMNEVVRLAAEKSAQRYAATQAQINAAQTQASAQVDSLDRQVVSLKAQRDARLAGLRQQINGLEHGNGMEADALRKHAAALERTTTEAAMAISQGAADAAFDANEAEAHRVMQSGQQLKISSQAQAEHMRADAATHFQQAKNDYEAELKAIERFVQHSSAEIDYRRQQIAQLDAKQAEVMRSQCDALSKQVAVTAQKRTSEAQAWWASQQQEHANQLAKADVMARKGVADGDELIARGEAALRLAAQMRKEAYEASDADRQTAAARILGLASGAQALDVTAEAQVEHLKAALKSFEDNSKAELDALVARREAAKVRGEAEVARLKTQADSDVKANAAAIEQMHAQRQAAEAMLSAEVAKLDQAASSYLAIAKATYDQEIASANAFKSMAETTMHEMLAVSAAEAKIGEAQVAFAQQMQQVAKMTGDMNAAAQLVESNSMYGFAEAQDASVRAELNARANAAKAAAEAQLAAAQANDQALWFAFNQQIAQASVQQGVPANQFGGSPIDAGATWPTGAAAVAFRTMSAQALDRLNDQALQFTAAAGGAFWSPINLNPGFGAFALPGDASAAYDFVTWQIDPNAAPASSTITNVPVDFDN